LEEREKKKNFKEIMIKKKPFFSFRILQFFFNLYALKQNAMKIAPVTCDLQQKENNKKY